MKSGIKGISLGRAFLVVLGAVFVTAVFFMVALSGIGAGTVAHAERYDVTATERNISAGVTETEYFTNTTSNDDQVVAYAVEIDMSVNTLIAGYKDYDTSGEWGLQTVREQAAAASEARNANIVVAVNGDYFNMGTGEPTGALVMDGEEVHASNGRPYFAVLKDGPAVIREGELRGDEAEAIGSPMVLVRDGEIVADEADTVKQPRTAVGIKANGDVVIIVADGRQTPYSSGYNYYDLAVKFKEAGCVDAVNLDGGGSTTYLAKYAGTDELTLSNSPSDGQERSVSTSLFVVSRAEATGVFGSVEMTPDNQVYTPGSAVTLNAVGADTNGFATAIPEGVTWQVSDDSMGSVTAARSDDGGMTVTFDAAAEKTGTVTVSAVYEGKIVGDADIVLQWPDKLTMTNSVYSLDFGERTDFGITAYWNTRVVGLKTGDLEWTVGDTGVTDDDGLPVVIGAMDGDVFVADDEATNVTATVTATLKHNASVTVSAEVSVGQLPTVAWDFEDVRDGSGEVIQTAEEYYTTTGDDSRFVVTTVSSGGSGYTTLGSAQLVDADTGEVRVGQHAMQINYDFTNAAATAGVYFGPREEVTIPGHPTGIGMWIYVPEGTPDFWLRSYLYGFNEDGSRAPGNVTWEDVPAYVCNFTNAGDELKAGWNYYEADLTGFTSPAYTWSLREQTFRIMYTSSTGTNSAGFLYVDNFQFVYGANTDDLNAPELGRVALDGMDGEELTDGAVITRNTFSVYAAFNEFEETYAQGVNVEDLHVYVDGNEVPLALASEIELYTDDVTLPDGEHEITVEVNDNFRNTVTRSFSVTVAGGASYAGVTLSSNAAAPYLGSGYPLVLSADRAEMVEEITADIRLGTGLTLEYGNVAEGFEVTECRLVHVNNNIYRVTVRRSADATVSGEAALATLYVHCPTDLNEGATLSYSVESSSVSYVEGFQSEVLNSFHAHEDGTEILSYYSVTADVMIVGSDGGYVYVTDPEGAPASGVHVTVDGAEIGVTDAEGKLFTDVFVGEVCSKTLAVYSDAGYSFGSIVNGVLPGGESTEGTPSAQPAFVRSVATENGNTEQRIVWMINPLAADADKAFVKYATAADYAEKGEAAFVTIEAEHVVMEFTDGYAVGIDSCLMTDLEPGTEYVYVAGNGTVWSAVKTFSTTRRYDTTDLIVIGDTQSDDPGVLEAIGGSIAGSGVDYDFAIQTGDFVDSGGSYALWDSILSVFSEYLSDIDFVQVFGNHEYEGNTDGRFPETVNFTPGSDYYSVTYGNVYVAVINCYMESDMKEAVEWIRADAAKSDATWKILTLHRPPYYTNVIGGSENSHALLPALVDEADFDVVFSGHDHSFARTEPLTGGEVDPEHGAVYYIVGAAEKGGKYEITDDPSFHFAKVSGDFNAMYLSVSADYTQMTINAYALTDEGTFELFDSYTVHDGSHPDEHAYVYDAASGKLTCTYCHYETTPEAISFGGLVEDTDGNNMFFTAGVPQTGWISVGEDLYYFGADKLGARGELTIPAMEYPENGDMRFEFDNGKLVGGDTRWYGDRYYVNGRFITGWAQIDGDIYCFATGNELQDGRVIGDKLTGYCCVRVNTQPYWTNYYFYFAEDGKLISGDFHKRSEGNYSLPEAVARADGSIQIRYVWNSWATVNGERYYFAADASMVTGDVVIDGVKYRFADMTGDPRETDSGKYLGRYYDVTFDDGTGEPFSAEVFEGERVTLPSDPVKAGNSVKTYEFVGWYEGNSLFDGTQAVTRDVTLTARFDAVYSAEYVTLTDALAALDNAEGDGSVKAALKAVEAALDDMTDTEKADALAEGVDLTEYERLYAEHMYHDVTFTDGDRTQTVTGVFEGNVVTVPFTPSKAGNSIKEYVFDGWYEGDVKVDLTQGVTRDMTLTARYVERGTELFVELTDKLAAMESSAEGGDAEDIKSALLVVKAVCDGLTEEELADAAVLGADLTAYSELYNEYMYHDVTFTDGDRTQTVTGVFEGNVVTVPFTPSKAGNSIKEYVFDGWYEGDVKVDLTQGVTRDMTLTAHYVAVYAEEYETLAVALDGLDELTDASTATRFEKLTAVKRAYDALTDTQKTDAAAEDGRVATALGMIADYDELAANGAADLDAARNVPDAFTALAATLATLAAGAFVAMFRR